MQNSSTMVYATATNAVSSVKKLVVVGAMRVDLVGEGFEDEVWGRPTDTDVNPAPSNVYSRPIFCPSFPDFPYVTSSGVTHSSDCYMILGVNDFLLHVYVDLSRLISVAYTKLYVVGRSFAQSGLSNAGREHPERARSVSAVTIFISCPVCCSRLRACPLQYTLFPRHTWPRPTVIDFGENQFL
ncbi:hypothetical protein K402DRAFT_399983 [Aulographum hederae CBS 113979]|uniref:Uncharacterized protein n=1 Tax=Aulographum hederae CBS 113979 TaxID=1176131 RepID=A0A6G1HGA3_9PEZI|nr:hypothetical protein K402DRAFT_399983 [Aulographum hederae CBS 113979]